MVLGVQIFDPHHPKLGKAFHTTALTEFTILELSNRLTPIQKQNHPRPRTIRFDGRGDPQMDFGRLL